MNLTLKFTFMHSHVYKSLVRCYIISFNKDNNFYLTIKLWQEYSKTTAWSKNH